MPCWLRRARSRSRPGPDVSLLWPGTPGLSRRIHFVERRAEFPMG
jgi:hypothetical protein